MSVLVGKEVPGFISQAVLPDGELVDDFDLEKRGTVELKGKGNVFTYFLQGLRESNPTPA